MRTKKITALIVALFLVFILTQQVLAITASLGNSRMVLRIEKGESMERYLTIKNVNEVPVKINLEVSGDLKDSLELDEKEFTLTPNEEKRAYFTITATKDGTTETKIGVKFSPEEGNAVALAANIIVIASNSDGTSTNSAEGTTEENKDKNETSSGFSFKQNPIATEEAVNSKSFEFSPIMMLSISTLVLAIVLVALFVYSQKKRGQTKLKKSVKRSA